MVKANRKPRTYLRIADIVDHLTAFLGTKKLTELTAWHLEQFKKARKDAGKAPATVNLELTYVKTMLRKARSWGNLAEDPGREVRPLTGVHGKVRFLSEEEARLLAACSPALRQVIQAGVLTGFRRQELISLRPEDIDGARKTVSVAAHNSKDGEGRTLPCGPRLMATVQEALARCGTAGAVFVSEKGIPWTTHTFGKACTQACHRAALELLSPHVLRHTFASRLVMAGVDLRTVQDLMGHKSILMAMRYAHLSPDHKRAAMETLETRFAGKSPATFPDTPLAALPEERGKLPVAR